MAETTPQMLARLVNGGGRILVVGGNVMELPPPFINHPKIVLWDDNREGITNRDVPRNTVAIIWNRLVSHNTVARLNQAANVFHAVKFPMQHMREIKELLSEVVKTTKAEVAPVAVDRPFIVTEDPPVKTQQTAKKGQLQQLIAKHLKANLDLDERGVIVAEGKRLFQIARTEKVACTEGSMVQAVGKFIRQLRRAKQKPVERKATPPAATTEAADDFDGIEQLIVDALAAMKLVQEHIPKLRREVTKLRIAHKKMKALVE